MHPRTRSCVPASLTVVLLVLMATGRAADIAQWDFDGDLGASTDHDPLAELGVGFPVEFESVLIGGASAEVAHFSRGNYFEVPHGTPPNGGGGYVNQYTLVMDVMFPDRSPSLGWASLLQTNCCNQNDGDWFIDPNDGLGIAGIYGGSVPEGEWHRLALVVDLVAGTFTSFVDGVQVQQATGGELGLDGRFALYSPTDTDAAAYETFFIFADESGDDAEGFVNSFQFRDVALAASEIAALGGPTAAGIPLPTDPRDCAFREFTASYDAAANRVTGSWLPLPGEQGFRVFQGARQIGGDLPPAATSFTDTTPPGGGVDVVYTLKPLRAGGTVERECNAAPIDTFGCISDLACCADQAARTVRLEWEAPVNIAPSGISIRRDGVEIGTVGAAATSFTNGPLPLGRHAYEVHVLVGGSSVCSAACRVAVTGEAIPGPGGCGGTVNTYQFNGSLASSTGGLDLVPMVSPPLAPADPPSVTFGAAQINGEPAQVARYSRGTFLRMYTGLEPNGGGIYTNQFTLMMDVLFEPGAIDESGWAALFQTNETNANDGDWFVRGSDRAVGIDGVYGGLVDDGVWHRLALVVDLVAGTFTSYVDGVQAQQNTGQGLDGRFSLYSVNDGPVEGISLFADDSGDNSAGLVNSVQIRDVPLTADEVAAFGGPAAAGIPSNPPCPSSLVCEVDQAQDRVTLRWQPGSGVQGTGYEILRDGVVIATPGLGSSSHADSGVAAGVHLYQLRINGHEGSCGNLPLSCQAEIVGPNLFFEDFERYADDAALAAAGWEVRRVNDPVEDSDWTVENPGRRRNPPTFNGRPTNGRFAISDSDAGGAADRQNVPGSGMSHDLWSPAFGTTGAGPVWLHADVGAQLNNDGDAVFSVDVSIDGGASWTSVLERVSPGRAFEPSPIYDENADGLFGRVHVDISAPAANRPAVRLRFRHLEPTWDWWAAIDNVLVDRSPPGGGSAVLPEVSFTGGIPPAWDVVSGPGSDSMDPWSTDDACMLSLGAAGGAFPDAADGRQLHHLDDDFALVDPFCSIARQDEYLLTPILDLSTYDGAFLNFKSSVLPTAGAVAEVLVSIDAGNTFSREPLFSYSAGALVAAEEDPVYGEHVLDASRVAGEGTVCFAFHYRTVGNADPPGTWWAIDDVSVTGVRGGRTLFHRGDPFNTGVINLTNGVAILNFLFLGGARPVCREAADVNNDAVVNLTDAVNVFNFLFLGGPPPADPGPISRPCGPDPDAPGSPGDLGCDTYDRC